MTICRVQFAIQFYAIISSANASKQKVFHIHIPLTLSVVVYTFGRI